MNYSDKLKSPKWQKKRLEILNLHKFKCDECKSEIKTLHVHHRFYLKGREPWEYDNDVFQVLCEDCHKEEHETKSKIIEVVPKKYQELIEFFNQFDDIQIGKFIDSVCGTIHRDNMEDFISVMYYVGSIGFDAGFSDLIEEDRKESNEIDQHIKICELKSQVEYLVKMTGFKKPDDTDLSF